MARLDVAQRVAATAGLIASLAVFSAGGAAAQAPTNPMLAADRAQLAACLRQAQAEPRSCVGLVAVACVRSAQAERGRAEQLCARREEAVWRERLVQLSQNLARRLDTGERARFSALQLAWESYVAQKCAFYAGQQPASVQPGRMAGCELREVAWRSLELEPTMRSAVPGPRRPQGPPQIIR
jgi:hypothetical protein